MMISCHEMMVSCHEMTISCHEMTTLQLKKIISFATNITNFIHNCKSCEGQRWKALCDEEGWKEKSTNFADDTED